MLVYGDATFPLVREALIGHLQAYAEMGDLASLRAGLILAGQWEQGVADSHPGVRQWEGVTDAAANAFLSRWSCESVNPPPPQFPSTPKEVEVRVPEGYAHYALYPEQYAAAAEQWAAGQDRAGHVLVVGIRTIGTSLSAVVRAALCRLGFRADRVTVRPTGHPFERQVRLPLERVQASRALVVDEGPGLSGSSMAAAAEALVRQGIPEDAITFLTAHEGLPGSFGSEAVRRRWERTPRLAAGRHEPAWEGQRLSEALGAATSNLAGGVPVSGVEDPGRALFGRPRIRVRLADGTSWVWKFYGSCVVDHRAAPADQLAYASMASGSYGIRPHAVVHGWLAFRWVEGHPITSEFRSLTLKSKLGRHIRERAQDPMPGDAHEEGLLRLRRMLRVNLPEGLDQETADELIARAEIARRVPEGLPTAGDYRMGPEHWILTEQEALVKVSGGWHTDHTLVGRQPFLWDLAGAAVEWELTAREREQVAFSTGLPVDPVAFGLYRLAYAAFRMGQCVMAAAAATEPERSAQEAAAERYRRFLRGLAHEA